MKIRTWSYEQPETISNVGCLTLIASNIRIAEFEPEFGILEQCWVYIYDLEIVERKEAGMFVNNDGVVCDECSGCIFASKEGCNKPSFISNCWKDKGKKNE